MHEEYDSREKTAYQQGDHLTRFDCEVSEKQHDVFVLLVLDMPLLCISVVFDGQSIIPWTISSIQPGQTFLGLYPSAGAIECFVESASKLQPSKLFQASVGQTKDTLNAVDIQLPMDEVCKHTSYFFCFTSHFLT